MRQRGPARGRRNILEGHGRHLARFADPVADDTGWFASADYAAFTNGGDEPGWGFGFVAPGNAFGAIGYRGDGDAADIYAGVQLDGITLVAKALRPDAECASSVEREGFRSPMPSACHYDYSYDGIMRSWEASLQRLGLAQVDILFIHDFGVRGSNNELMFGQLVRGGGFRALEELRGSGAIRAFDLGVNEWEV